MVPPSSCPCAQCTGWPLAHLRFYVGSHEAPADIQIHKCMEIQPHLHSHGSVGPSWPLGQTKQKQKRNNTGISTQIHNEYLPGAAERSHWVWLAHQTSTVNDRPAQSSGILRASLLHKCTNALLAQRYLHSPHFHCFISDLHRFCKTKILLKATCRQGNVSKLDFSLSSQ